jgi:hypothetical protein
MIPYSYRDVIQQEQNSVIWEYGYRDQLQIGKDIRVELQIPPSAYLNFRGVDKRQRIGG